jgi:UDP-3-O-[3-hydroxymyristoyl] glucosamine N-acyltransferase
MTIREIAEWLAGEVVGSNVESAPEIERVAKIEEADPGSLTFLANPKYEKHLDSTQATAVLVSRKFDLKKIGGRASRIFIRVDDPYVAFLHMLKRLTPTVEPFTSGIHSTAVVPSSAVIGKNISIGSYAVIGEHAVIGDNTKIGAGCVIGNHAQVGSECILYPNVVVYHQCKIGNRVILHAGAVIGSDGFGFAPKADGTYEKILQLGIVIIDDDVEIGANTTIDRATIAHNVVIGEHTVIAAQTGISGSTKIGKHCMLAGQVGIAGHIEIADRTVIMAQSGIPKSIEEPGKSYFGYPADEARTAQRVSVAMKMLPDMLREFTALQKKVAELERKLLEK